MPNIGYGSNKKTRHMLPTGFRKVLVHNVKVCIQLYIWLRLFYKFKVSYDFLEKYFFIYRSDNTSISTYENVELNLTGNFWRGL